MVILLIVSATIPWLLEVFFRAWMLRCRPQAERSSFSAEVNWQETAHEKSLAPRVSPLRHILAKAPSTSTWTFPERKFLTDAKSGFFFIRWRNNIEPSSFPWILYSRWQPRCQVLSRPRALFYNACSVANFPSGVLVLEWSRIRVRYVWTWKLESGKKKLWIQKHPDACGGGLKLVEEWRRLSRFPTKRTATAWYWEILVLVMSWVC